jgi:hypothetical protein
VAVAVIRAAAVDRVEAQVACTPNWLWEKRMPVSMM